MSLQTIPLFPGVPGGIELAVILLIAILLFGANKIPKLARSTGQAMGEFKKGREQVEQELQEIQEGSPAEDTAGGTSTTQTESTTPSETTTESTETEPADRETESEQ